MAKLFISHSSQDDAFVRNLRTALADLGEDGWIDSRELRGGDPLWPVIQKAIEAASAYAVVVSPDSLQSKWVGKELSYALTLREQRGENRFPVIPLSLNGTKLGVLEEFFGEEPTYIPMSSDAGGVEAAMNDLLVVELRRTRRMVCFVDVKSVDRVIYSSFYRFNLDWKDRTFGGFTQASTLPGRSLQETHSVK